MDSSSRAWLALALLPLVGCASVGSVGLDVDDPDVDTEPEREVDPALTTHYQDVDGDGFGDPDTAFVNELEVMEGVVQNGDDCDDTDPGVNPDSVEICDGIDQDCDGEVDEEAVDAQPFFLDGDGDGFGTLPLGAACTPPPGAAEADGDCNDDDAAVFPGADEPVCTLVDYDCDGEIGDAASTGGRRYATIQGAIDRAVEGGTVTVCRGNREASLRVERGVRLIGETLDADDTAIAAAGDGPVVQATGDWVTIKGITFVSAVDQPAVVVDSNTLHVEACRFEGAGSGLVWQGRDSSRRDGAELRVEDTIFDGLSGRDGAALVAAADRRKGKIEIDSSVFDHNAAARFGGAASIRVEDGNSLLISRTRFQENTAGDSGGALSISGAGSASITTSSFAANEAAGSSSITVEGTLELDDVTVRGDAGEQAVSAGELVAVDLTVEDVEGYAVLGRGDVSLEDCTLHRNDGGVALDAGAELVLTAVDLGLGSDENAGADVSIADGTWDWSGVVSTTCSRGTCTEP